MLEQQFLEEIAEAERQKIFLRQKDEHFNSWAEKCINEWDKNVRFGLMKGQKHQAPPDGTEELHQETRDCLSVY